MTRQVAWKSFRNYDVLFTSYGIFAMKLAEYEHFQGLDLLFPHTLETTKFCTKDMLFKGGIIFAPPPQKKKQII